MTFDTTSILDFVQHPPSELLLITATLTGAFLALGIATDTHKRWKFILVGVVGIGSSTWLLVDTQSANAAGADPTLIQLVEFVYVAMVVPALALLVGVLGAYFARDYANTLAVMMMTDSEVEKERERRDDDEIEVGAPALLTDPFDED